MFNITSKYFSFLNNKPPATWAVHIIRDFLTCYSCSYYSSMVCANITYHVQIRREHVEFFPLTTKNIISPLPQYLWPLNMAWWWLTMKCSHKVTWPVNHVVLWPLNLIGCWFTLKELLPIKLHDPLITW